MDSKWSSEYLLVETEVERTPKKPGAYRIYQSKRYNRYKGATRIIKIGMSGSNLSKELKNHLNRHIVANRIKRITNQEEIKVTFDYLITENKEKATKLERDLLIQFENDHFELPVLNSQRGYRRGEDKYFFP